MQPQTRTVFESQCRKAALSQGAVRAVDHGCETGETGMARTGQQALGTLPLGTALLRAAGSNRGGTALDGSGTLAHDAASGRSGIESVPESLGTTVAALATNSPGGLRVYGSEQRQRRGETKLTPSVKPLVRPELGRPELGCTARTLSPAHCPQSSTHVEFGPTHVEFGYQPTGDTSASTNSGRQREPDQLLLPWSTTVKGSVPLCGAPVDGRRRKRGGTPPRTNGWKQAGGWM